MLLYQRLTAIAVEIGHICHVRSHRHRLTRWIDVASYCHVLRWALPSHGFMRFRSMGFLSSSVSEVSTLPSRGGTTYAYYLTLVYKHKHSLNAWHSDGWWGWCVVCPGNRVKGGTQCVLTSHHCIHLIVSTFESLFLFVLQREANTVWFWTLDSNLKDWQWMLLCSRLRFVFVCFICPLPVLHYCRTSFGFSILLLFWSAVCHHSRKDHTDQSPTLLIHQHRIEL